MSLVDAASRMAPGLTDRRTQGRARSVVRNAFRLVGMSCVAAILASCSAHAAQPRHTSPVQQDTGNKTVTSGAEPFTVDNDDYPLDLLTLSLVRRIYAAATHTDYAELNQLLRNYCSEPASAEDAQIKLWHNPEVLREMAAILLTHGATTDGYTYPGFAIAGFQTSYDYEDAAELDVKAPRIPTLTSSYKGPTISISWPFMPHSTPHWCGIENYGK